MDIKTMNPRQEFLKTIQYEKISIAIRAGKIWLATQRMLKRTGKTFSIESSENSSDKMIFSFDEIRHLYLLQLAATHIKSVKGYSSWVEISLLQERVPRLVSWATSHMIIPSSVRRKVDAYRQIKTSSEKQQSTSVKEFSGSLYSALHQALESKSAADKLISQLPSTHEDARKITEPDIKAYGYVGKTIAPVFVLFTLECKRLGYSTEHEVLLRLQRLIKDSDKLNMLGNSLYFTFLYPDDEDLFSHFFIEYQKGTKSSGEREVYATKFIQDVYSRYLHTANKRNYIKRKRKKWSE